MRWVVGQKEIRLMSIKRREELRFNELLSSLNFKTKGNHDFLNINKINKMYFIDRGIYDAIIVDAKTGLEYNIKTVIDHSFNFNEKYSFAEKHFYTDEKMIVTNHKNNSISSIILKCANTINSLDATLRTLRKIIDGDVSYGMIMKQVLSISSKHRGHDRITINDIALSPIMFHEVIENWSPNENKISNIDDVFQSKNIKLLKSLCRNNHMKIDNMVRSNDGCYSGLLKTDAIPSGMFFYLGNSFEYSNQNKNDLILCWPNTNGIKALMDNDDIVKGANISYYDSISSMLPTNDNKKPKSYVSGCNMSLSEAMELYLKRSTKNDEVRTEIKYNTLKITRYNHTAWINIEQNMCSYFLRNYEGENEVLTFNKAISINDIIKFYSYYCSVYMATKKMFDFIYSKLHEDGYNAELTGNGEIIVDSKLKPELYIKADFNSSYNLIGLKLMETVYSRLHIDENDNCIFEFSSLYHDSFMIDNWYRLRMFIDMVEHEVDPTHRTPGIEAED